MTSDVADRLILAFADLVGAERVLVLGSQAIHAHYKNPPIEIVVTSREVDLLPLPYEAFDNWFYYAHERLGADSEFDLAQGFYVDMLRASMVKLPKDWENRAIERTLTNGERSVHSVYPDLYDLLASKLVAGRPSDVAFLKGVNELSPLDGDRLARQIESVDVSRQCKANALQIIAETL